jgi:hypothetical protein
MSSTFDDLPGWTFDIQEISMGSYQIVAKDTAGRRMIKKGPESELSGMMIECKEYARKFIPPSKPRSDQLAAYIFF